MWIVQAGRDRPPIRGTPRHAGADEEEGFGMISHLGPRHAAGQVLRAFTSLAVAGSLVLSTGITTAAPVAAAPGYPAACLPGSGHIWGCGTLTDAQLHQLVGMMTLAEEDNLIHGGGSGSGAGEAGSANGVMRLGIPTVHLTDGPAGVRLSTQETAEPAPVGLTATWDPSAALAFGTQVGQAARSTGYNDPPGYGDGVSRGQTVWLAPMMNQVVVPTAGRNFETLGEDQNLASALAVQEVIGVQNNGMIAQIKHYVDNDFENGRNSASVYVDERTIHEGEMQAFSASIAAGAGSVMCSYNRVNDIYACSNDLTLKNILKGQFGLQGFVTTDWGAVHRSQDLMSGLDMEQSSSGSLGTSIVNNVGASSTLLVSTVAGATSLKLTSVSHIAVGNTITVDGGNVQTSTVAAVGTAGTSTTISGLSTTLAAAYTPGDAAIKVSSVSNMAVGQTLTLDYVGAQETGVIASVGSSGSGGTGITLTPMPAQAHAQNTAIRTATPAGSTNVKVGSTSGMAVGDILTIGSFGYLEAVTITAVGSTGVGGVGVSFTPGLTKMHNNSEVVVDITTNSGTGVTLSSPLTLAHTAGSPVIVYGDGTAAVSATNDLPPAPAYTAAQWKARMDDAVYRILKQLNNIGELEGTPFGTMAAGCDGTTVPCHPYIPASPALASMQSDHFAVAQSIAEESATLLRNDDNLLPLTSADWSGGNRVAVIGPNAFQTYTGGGGSARVIPIAGQVPTSYDSLVQAAPAGANITYALGYAPSATVEGFAVPSQGGSATHAASSVDPVAVPAGPGFLREQTTYAVTPAGSAATHCTVGDPGCAPDQADQSIEYSDLTPTTTLPMGTAWRWTGAVTAPDNGPWELRVCYGFVGANSGNGSIQLYASQSALTDSPASSDRVVNVTSASATNLDTQSLTGQCHNPGYMQQSVRASGAGTNIPSGATRNIQLRAVANGTRDLRVYLEWAPVGTTMYTGNVSTTLNVPSTTLTAASAAGVSTVNVASLTGFTDGLSIGIDTGANAETATVASTLNSTLPIPAYTNPNQMYIGNVPDLSQMAVAHLYWRKTFTVADKSTIAQAVLRATGDDNVAMYVNGTLLGTTTCYNCSNIYDVTSLLQNGTNVIALDNNNTGADGMIISTLDLYPTGGGAKTSIYTTTGAGWKWSITSPTGWTGSAYDDSAWSSTVYGYVYPAAPWNTLNATTPTINSITFTAPLAKAHAASVVLGGITPAGTSTIPVASVSGFTTGRSITIDTGANLESATIASVGTNSLTLAAPLTMDHVGAVAVVAPPAADNLRVASVAGFVVGQTIQVDTGANQEAAVITAIGTSGQTGTGFTLAAPLTRTHSNGAAVAGETMQDAVIADAVAKASVPGTTPVVFVYDDGTEGSDRGGNNAAAGMVLPGYQDLEVQSIVDANPNTIVVAMNGAPVYMPWAIPQPGHNAVKSILQMWYPGQRGGIATANVLLGTVNPGGKLPETFPVDATHYPQYESTCSQSALGSSSSSTGNVGTCSLYPGVYMPGFLKTATSGNLHNYRTINFSNSTLLDTGVSANPALTYPDDAASTLAIPATTGNGIYTGYRWYDWAGVDPLFEFGHGLSYTTFAYSNLSIGAGTAGGAVDMSFDLKNTGSVAGDETPQIYIGSPMSPPVPMAVNALAAFQRIHLAAGETKHVTLHAALRSFQYWQVSAPNFVNNDVDGWATADGCRTISVGTSSRNFPLVGMADETGGTSACDTTTTVAADFNPSQVGHPVTFTATVVRRAPTAATPTGDVQFSIDGAPSAARWRSTRPARPPWARSPAWPSARTRSSADYSGDAAFLASSGSVDQVVKKRLGTSTVVTSDLNPRASAAW